MDFFKVVFEFFFIGWFFGVLLFVYICFYMVVGVIRFVIMIIKCVCFLRLKDVDFEKEDEDIVSSNYYIII